MITRIPQRAALGWDVPVRSYPTVWGLDPIQLHDRFWAARGVFVVRQGAVSEIHGDAELYLLIDPGTLAIFRLAPLIETLSWVQPTVMFLRLLSRDQIQYRERVLTDKSGNFVRFQRLYGAAMARPTRAALTRDATIAAAWQSSNTSSVAWRKLRRESRALRREIATIHGRAFDRNDDESVASFVKELMNLWNYPPSTIPEIRKAATNVWAHEGAEFDRSVRFIGSAWVGAGRKIAPGSTVVGPAVLWDDPSHQVKANGVRWAELEPTRTIVAPQRPDAANRSRVPFGKRAFDIVFALAATIVTLPIYAVVMLLIWLEDGRPFFFLHKRQTLGGREFPCIKFRSMRKDAEQIKAELAKANKADGPQFFIPDDPRLTRVGSFIRKTNIDELPQFINVLLGHMSIVGPRPSPASENQFNPTWRDARLSVRAGITGLWQVSRTRRRGFDFQEWIKYDLEYVQNASWWMDVAIILRTLGVLLRR
jgi:lipopolysaccharide/colanic/teichoic acid biosynthesis glycosyltransferase